MASFTVNESLFVLDLDDDAPSILPVGEMLPDGITIEVDRDRGENYVKITPSTSALTANTIS